MKLLYLSCHEILEYDEVKLFTEMGIDVFPLGAYLNRSSGEINENSQGLRPDIPGLKVNEKDMEAYHKSVHDTYMPIIPGNERDILLSGKRLTREFVDRFDAVMIMHVPLWIFANWEQIKHKPVIWRTIGQSISYNEKSLATHRGSGLKIVRYSPKEQNILQTIGVDALIRFYKDPDEFNEWKGDNNKVISISQSMKQRGKHCHFDIFKDATEGLDRMLFGPKNEETGIPGGLISYPQLKEELASARVYFYTGTQPASYTLNFMEAAMTGVPMVAISAKTANEIYKSDLYEVEDIINKYECGYVSDDPAELRRHILNIMEDDELAKELSRKTKIMAMDLFAKDKIKQQWKDFFATL